MSGVDTFKSMVTNIFKVTPAARARWCKFISCQKLPSYAMQQPSALAMYSRTAGNLG